MATEKTAGAGPTASPAALAQWRAHHARLTACLAGPGWSSEGSAQDRGPGAGGPCYQWTRKVRGKTVSVAFSRDQYAALAAAIANWRSVQATLRAMQRLSRTVRFTTLPGAPPANASARRSAGWLKRPSATDPLSPASGPLPLN